MPSADRRKSEDSQIMLGILEAIDGHETVTQRAVASELGVALGLVNAYLKRCMKKGLIKMRTAPARRYAYYLTPEGFSEKSRLTASYLANSFSFFRRARQDCDAVLAKAAARRMQRIALIGASELAEIICLCAADKPLQILVVIDASVEADQFAGLKVVDGFDSIGQEIDGFIITNLTNPRDAYENAVAAVGADRVLIPALLNSRVSRGGAADSSGKRKAAQ